MSDKYIDSDYRKHLSESPAPSHEEDPELERDYRLLARILLDLYYEQQRSGCPQDEFDKKR